jgi:hypothetical protein
MRNRHAVIGLVCGAQYTAVGVGIAWGIGAAKGVLPLGPWTLTGTLAVLLLAVDAIRFQASPRLQTTNPIIPVVCYCLGLYAVLIMFGEPFLWYYDDSSFIKGIVLILPFLLAVSPLARAAAWIGVAGSCLFVATSLSMLTRNAFSLYESYGFFQAWVS